MYGPMLECEPLFRHSITAGVFHIYGGLVIQFSTIELQTVDVICPDLTDESCYSPPLVLHTAVWADVVAPYAEPLGPPQPDFSDIAAVVDKFLSDPTAPSKAHAQLQPNNVFPERPIDFRDIAAAVNGFLSVPYESLYHGPCTCPSTVTCGTPCANDADCAGTGHCRGGFCYDFCHRCTP